MVSPAGRRKVRKRKSQAENVKVRLGIIIGIMAAAIFLGFLTARFVIGPIIGYNADESPIKQVENAKEKERAEDRAKEQAEDEDSGVETSAAPTEGYALQFGAFSTKEAAQKLAGELKEKGVKTEIVEIDKVFKVISPVIDKKADALSAIEDVKDKDVSDVFVTSFE